MAAIALRTPGQSKRLHSVPPCGYAERLDASGDLTLLARGMNGGPRIDL